MLQNHELKEAAADLARSAPTAWDALRAAFQAERTRDIERLVHLALDASRSAPAVAGRVKLWHDLLGIFDSAR